MFRKITLSLLCASALVYASDYSRANSAAAQAFKDLDCEFEDCSVKKAPPPPKVIVQEKVIVKEKPVIVEKVVYKEKVVYRDKPQPKEPEPQKQVASDNSQRLYNAKIDVPIIGIDRSGLYDDMEKIYMEDQEHLKVRKSEHYYMIENQSPVTWAEVEIKDGKTIFLSKYDNTIPYHRYNIGEIKFHVELPQKVIHNDSTVVSLPHPLFSNSSGNAEEYASCTFNGFVPEKGHLQEIVKLNGKDYLDVTCTVAFYGYNLENSSVNREVQNMIRSESFKFIPEFRVYPPVKKGSKKAVLGTQLKKFVFPDEIAE